MTIPDRYGVREDESGNNRLFDLKLNKFVVMARGSCEAHNRAYRQWIAESEAWQNRNTDEASAATFVIAHNDDRPFGVHS